MHPPDATGTKGAAMGQDSQGETADETTRAAMQQMIHGFVFPPMLYVAAKLGIADLLADGPQPIDALAAATGTHASSLYRVLRALASRGVFTQDEGQCFALTPQAALLRTNVPGSLRSMAVYWGSPWLWNAWSHLLDGVQTGQTAFDLAHGTSFFAYLAQHPDDAEVFNQYMAEAPMQRHAAVAAASDFSGMRLVVDVGGGHGASLIALLQAHPALRGVLFDLPQVVAGARDHLLAAGVADRCDPVGGDFFASVPPGGDAYLLEAVLHDWDDDRALHILQNCRRVMAGHGKLFVAELIVPEGNAPSQAKLVDVVMLTMLGGQQRTEAEFRALYARAGFQLTNVVLTPSGMYVIEGVPV
jgi:O-methyltransferase domain/Dimerisation domain